MTRMGSLTSVIGSCTSWLHTAEDTSARNDTCHREGTRFRYENPVQVGEMHKKRSVDLVESNGRAVIGLQKASGNATSANCCEMLLRQFREGFAAELLKALFEPRTFLTEASMQQTKVRRS